MMYLCLQCLLFSSKLEPSHNLVVRARQVNSCFAAILVEHVLLIIDELETSQDKDYEIVRTYTHLNKYICP